MRLCVIIITGIRVAIAIDVPRHKSPIGNFRETQKGPKQAKGLYDDCKNFRVDNRFNRGRGLGLWFVGKPVEVSVR
jgi:hypothetical protein